MAARLFDGGQRSTTPAWAGLAALLNCTDAEFRAHAEPLGQMTSLAYTATHGSYFNSSTVNSTVDSWVRGLTANPPGGGMRALLFLQPRTQRGVVAFRGTDLDRHAASGQADACADHILFNESGALPEFCAQFDAATLDYFARALEFVAEVRAAHPNLDLLFTGHSLGAGLAMMMSVAAPASQPGVPAAEVKWPVVGFGTPAWLQPLLRRTGLSPGAAAARPLFAIADAYDPVEAVAVRDHGLMGTVCRWGMDKPPSAACGPCFANLQGGGTGSAAACSACFLQRHIFSHYMAALRGRRPDCVAAAGAHLPVAYASQAVPRRRVTRWKW